MENNRVIMLSRGGDLDALFSWENVRLNPNDSAISPRRSRSMCLLQRNSNERAFCGMTLCIDEGVKLFTNILIWDDWCS